MLPNRLRTRGSLPFHFLFIFLAVAAIDFRNFFGRCVPDSTGARRGFLETSWSKF